MLCIEKKRNIFFFNRILIQTILLLYILILTKQEKNIIKNCKEYDKKNEICLECEDNYYLNPEKICVLNDKRTIADKTICNIKNCISCTNRNECNKCYDGYYLTDHRCYSTKCEVYGFCKFCDEYDCLKCLTGYKLTYGICDEKENALQMKLMLGIGIPFIVIFSIIFLCYYCQKRTKNIIESGKILNFRHPKAGNYIISLPDSKDELNESEAIKYINKSPEIFLPEERGELNECIICCKKKVYTFADCGCALCFKHWKAVKNDPERFICRIHNIPLTKYITFHLNNKSTIKGNAVDKLCLSVCPVCKVSPGTMDFGCECKLKVCQKCFNDNLYILKYNQCPGCGEPYVPSNSGSKKRKESDKSSNKDKSSKNSSRKGSSIGS